MIVRRVLVLLVPIALVANLALVYSEPATSFFYGVSLPWLHAFEMIGYAHSHPGRVLGSPNSQLLGEMIGCMSLVAAAFTTSCALTWLWTRKPKGIK